MLRVPDIYFLPEWGKYFEEKEKDGELRIFELKHELGHVYYQFIIRPIPIDMEGTIYYDTITPYGWSGPIVLECVPQRIEELNSLFNQEFQKYCEKNKIVTEYIRFNPWLKNLGDFEKIYDARNQGTTIFIDLTVKDFFMEEFSSASRRQVRRAQKNNVEIEFDFDGSTIEEFSRLYELTAKRNGIQDYYLFSKEFLENSFQHLAGKQFLINAKHEGNYISSCLVIHHEEYVHYHLMANDPEYFHLAANSLIIYEACLWGVANKKKELHLGGAAGDEQLDRFKRKFTKTEPLDFLVGKKVRNEKVYEQLVQYKKENGGIENPDFFPLYRG